MKSHCKPQHARKSKVVEFVENHSHIVSLASLCVIAGGTLMFPAQAQTMQNSDVGSYTYDAQSSTIVSRSAPRTPLKNRLKSNISTVHEASRLLALANGSYADKQDIRSKWYHEPTSDEKAALDKLKAAIDAGNKAIKDYSGKVTDGKIVENMQKTVADAQKFYDTHQHNLDILPQAPNFEKTLTDLAKQLKDSNAQYSAQQQQAQRAQAVAASIPQGEMQQWLHDDLISKGYSEADWNAANWIISRESGWRVNATNASSGAYGLPQALPGGKMASMGADWRTNYKTQLLWFENYCINRYGGFVQAQQAWVSKGWY